MHARPHRRETSVSGLRPRGSLWRWPQRPPSPSSWLASRLDRLAALQVRHAPWFVVASLALACSALPSLSKLGLDNSWTGLLPADAPSVRDLARVEHRIGGLSTLALVFQSDTPQPELLKRLVTESVPRLRHLHAQGVFTVDAAQGVGGDFISAHRELFTPLEDWRDLEAALRAWQARQVQARSLFSVDLQSSPQQLNDPSTVLRRMSARFAPAKEATTGHGYFLHPDGRRIALFVRSNIELGDAAASARLRAAVQREAEAVLRQYDPRERVTLGFAGDLIEARYEHAAIKSELVLASAVTLVAVMLVLLGFFGSWRVLPLLCCAVVVPVLVAFGAARPWVETLNHSTAFLGSIVVGNGVNPCIIWLARYFEERRRGVSVLDAVRRSHRSTWLATFVASLAAAGAYGSLVLTDFRGFRDFGVVGSLGMVLCWLSALCVLPSLAVLAERVSELRPATKSGKSFGCLIFRTVASHGRGITAVVILATLGGGLLLAEALRRDPLEYDFRRLRSLRDESNHVATTTRQLRGFVSSWRRGNAVALYVPQRSDVPGVVRQLEQLRQSGAPLGVAHSIDDLKPPNQAQKRALFQRIRPLMLAYRNQARPKVQQLIDANLPPSDVAAVGDRRLPASAAGPFTERSGVRGRIVYVEASEGANVWDGRYLMAWTAALRSLRLDNGERPPLIGRAPVFADVIAAMWDDGPKAVGASFAATLVLLAVAFRRRLHRLRALMSLLLGLVWMAATMAAFGMRLNFLNFLAFPITFGNGADYGVNLVRRYADERKVLGRREALGQTIGRSGGAVAVCSLTTIVGYASLFLSANQALRSFGAAMVISEVTCLLAAVVVVPAWMLRSRQYREGLARPVDELAVSQERKRATTVGPDRGPARHESKRKTG